MGQLDASIVTLTFKPMERDFGAPLAAVQWVSLAYLLVLVALVTPAGRIADVVGRKLVYGQGFVVFTIGSAACGLAPSLRLLIVFRVIQAVGAAMLQANSVALVTTSVPRAHMRLALSVQAAAQSVGLGLGPTLGGLLTQTDGWRAVYWINVPVGIVAVIAGRYLLPRTRQRSSSDSFDWIGAGLLAIATTTLLFALSVAGGLPLPGWTAGLMAGLAAVSAAGFALRQQRARVPLIPKEYLHSARLALGLAGAFLGYLTLFGPLVLIPQLEQGHGNAVRTGLMLSALPVGFGVAALTAERIFPAAMPNRTRGSIGATICAVALVLLMLLSSSAIAVVLLLGLAGLGLGVFVPANNAVIMRAGSASGAGVLGGLVNMARGIGTTMGIALVTLALHLGTSSSAGHGGHPDGTLAFLILAVAAACAAVIALIVRPLGPGTPEPGHARLGDSNPDHASMEHNSAFS